MLETHAQPIARESSVSCLRLLPPLLDHGCPVHYEPSLAWLVKSVGVTRCSLLFRSTYSTYTLSHCCTMPLTGTQGRRVGAGAGQVRGSCEVAAGHLRMTWRTRGASHLSGCQGGRGSRMCPGSWCQVRVLVLGARPRHTPRTCGSLVEQEFSERRIRVCTCWVRAGYRRSAPS